MPTSPAAESTSSKMVVKVYLVGGKGVSGGVGESKIDNSNAKDGWRKYYDTLNKCQRCLEPDHRWFDGTAHVIPAANQSKGSGDIVGCLANGMLGKRDAVGQREQVKNDA